MTRWTRIYDPQRELWMEVLLEEPPHLYRGANYPVSGPAAESKYIVDRLGRPIRSPVAVKSAMGFHL